MASALTIHSVDPTLSKRIAAMAKREGKSLNQTVKDALAEYFGLQTSRGSGKKRNGIMRHCGVLSAKDAEELRKAQSAFREVNPEDWG